MASFTEPETDTVFPGYENGDIFLSWNELGIKCYSEYDPAVAVKYVRNVVNQYESDGLAAQRYLRKSQTGAGDDILAGNYMTIAGLYSSIYGVHPFYNRLSLEPHITEDLSGTVLKYLLRGQQYLIRLISPKKYRISAGGFTVGHTKPFAVSLDRPDRLSYFFGNRKSKAVALARSNHASLDVDMAEYSDIRPAWTEVSGSDTTVSHTVSQLPPGTGYRIRVNGLPFRTLVSDRSGNLRFDAALCASVQYRFQLEEAAGPERTDSRGR